MNYRSILHAHIETICTALNYWNESNIQSHCKVNLIIAASIPITQGSLKICSLGLNSSIFLIESKQKKNQ